MNEKMVDMTDQLPLIIMISAMALIIALLLIIIFILWKKVRTKRKVVERDPFQVISEIYEDDKDGNGIPDHIDAIIRRMDNHIRSPPGNDVNHSSYYSMKHTRDGRTWGMTEKIVNGKRTFDRWGTPPDQGERLFHQLYDDYVNGNISAEDFRKEMDTLKVT